MSLLLTASARAQPPTPLPRALAGVSEIESDSSVWETAVAAGVEHVIAVFHAKGSNSTQIGYARAARQPDDTWVWNEEGLIDPNLADKLSDPSVAYDTVTGDFLVCAMTAVGDRILVARYDSGIEQFGPWQVARATGGAERFDKPWIVAGQVIEGLPACDKFPPLGPGVPLPPLQEFYIGWAVLAALPGGTLLTAPPGQVGVFGDGVDLAVDPTRPKWLYVAFHDTDTADPNDNDVNIYVQRLKRISGDRWRKVGTPIPVADDDDPLVETDQFMPAIKVDENGGIHVIFYDDRNYLRDDGSVATPEPLFDVFYAFSNDGGINWTNLELFEDPAEPALDFSLNLNNFKLRDYIGIDVGSDRVWTSFMGSTLQDTNADKSVIWSSQILLPGP